MLKPPHPLNFKDEENLTAEVANLSEPINLSLLGKDLDKLQKEGYLTTESKDKLKKQFEKLQNLRQPGQTMIMSNQPQKQSTEPSKDIIELTTQSRPPSSPKKS